jgi:hypothetical protein
MLAAVVWMSWQVERQSAYAVFARQEPSGVAQVTVQCLCMTYRLLPCIYQDSSLRLICACDICLTKSTCNDHKNVRFVVIVNQASTAYRRKLLLALCSRVILFLNWYVLHEGGCKDLPMLLEAAGPTACQCMPNEYGAIIPHPSQAAQLSVLIYAPVSESCREYSSLWVSGFTHINCTRLTKSDSQNEEFFEISNLSYI